jgi:predicted transcriptional regulator
MPRPKSSQPTDGELEILRILWEIGPAELGQIRAALLAHRNADRDIALTTVATMLKVMLDKGLVTRARGERSWLWSARASRQKTTRGMIGKILSNVFEGSASKLVMHLIEDGKLTAQEQAENRAMLEEHSKKTKAG